MIGIAQPAIPMAAMMVSCLVLFLAPVFLPPLAIVTAVPLPPPPRGDVYAVRSLLDRVLPPAPPVDGGDDASSPTTSSLTPPSSRFDLEIVPDGEGGALCSPPSSADGDYGGVRTGSNRVDLCFFLSDAPPNPASDLNRISVRATTASELSAGVGHYLRHHLNLTIGWPRGGGSYLVPPDPDGPWPAIGDEPVVRRRVAPYSYLLNVCAHSYSLVWYDWRQWSNFIDWLALSGVNMIVSPTGQEEVQYKVFTRLGLSDTDIRNWFNGPAMLTWSRGQNEHGSDILGPLPRSWMRDRWTLQKTQILPRLRSLGIVGQLPGFQGNVPMQLKSLYNDTNMTVAGDTGWMDSLDPLFGEIADLWMEILIEDFGPMTDHWYQLDGYFNGGTAPWMTMDEPSARLGSSPVDMHKVDDRATTTFDFGEVKPDDASYRRAEAAYMGLNRTDPDAIWAAQSWAFFRWSTPKQASIVKGYVEAVPPGRLVFNDMSSFGSGMWRYFNNSAWFGAPFLWTTLHNFGGNDGLKGNLSLVDRIPFDAPSLANVVGTGATPEGIDQNPLYYEFVLEGSFRDRPVGDDDALEAHVIGRAHRRYGLVDRDEDVARAWSLLVRGGPYSTDESELGVHDPSGVPHVHPPGALLFEDDRRTPGPILCNVFRAWGHLIRAAEKGRGLDEENPPASESSKRGDGGGGGGRFSSEPFTYDLINVGREVLANVATVAALNFTDATSRKPALNVTELLATGGFYLDVLRDLDDLVGTDGAFLLGPWLASARRLGVGHDDCASSILGNKDGNCADFYEWNSRTQITTWKPVTSRDKSKVPDGPIDDYASKHWNGLIWDYYAARVNITLQRALRDAADGAPLDDSEVDRLHARHAFDWTTARNEYPVEPVGDAVLVSRALHGKYEGWFAPPECGSSLPSKLDLGSPAVV